MNLVTLLEKLKSENASAVINGITGRIVEIGEELLTLETIRKKDRWEGKKKETAMVREITYIPISQIYTVSQGEKEIPKSEAEKNIEKELEVAVNG